MSLLAKLFSRKKSKEIVIAVAITDGLKLFTSIDDAIKFLKDSNSKESIAQLKKLKKRIGDPNIKAVRITENNEIILFDSISDLKKAKP